MGRKLLFLIFLGVLIIYWPSLFTFFTNDDFFHLKISNADSFSDFLNFFNLLKAPDGFGFYRPLTTQVFYFLGVKVFELNPLPLHILSFGVFFGGTLALYRLALILSGNAKVAILVCFLYAFSAMHFGHLYFLGTFQELGLFFFFICSLLAFVRFLKDHNNRNYLLAFTFFIFSLLSKETSVVLPAVLFLIWAYLKVQARPVISFKQLFRLLVPFVVILAIYLYLHMYFYGLATGDSYFTDYSVKKALNSLMWYTLWTIGIPELFVDFIGPGLKVNPNLFKFWAKETFIISGLFATLLLLLCGTCVKLLKTVKTNKFIYTAIFSVLFFVATLLPVLFFPFHKFSYNLTLPSFGIFFLVASVLTHAKLNTHVLYFCLGIFLFLNITTLTLTKKTHWIARGAETAGRVYIFFQENEEDFNGKTIVLYDTPEDASLPWSPTMLVKGVLSDQNFFDVFYPGQFNIIYGQKDGEQDVQYIRSRMFLGY